MIITTMIITTNSSKIKVNTSSPIVPSINEVTDTKIVVSDIHEQSTIKEQYFSVIKVGVGTVPQCMSR